MAPQLPPVVLVHGWGGSFEATWQRSGVAELLRDEGREVIGVDLLGHGSAPKPHDPAAYDDLGGRVLEAIDGAAPAGQVDAVGFSLGVMTLLRLAIDHPTRVRRLVLAGVGRNVLEPDEESGARIAAAVEGSGPDDDTPARVFAQYAHQPGNDPAALAAIMRRPRRPLDPVALQRITCPTLVVIGDADPAGPGEPLVAALPAARLKVLRRTDHFATPESFDFIDAMLRFLAEAP